MRTRWGVELLIVALSILPASCNALAEAWIDSNMSFLIWLCHQSVLATLNLSYFNRDDSTQS